MQNATIKITVDNLSNILPKKAILLGKTLIIEQFQRFKVVFNALIIKAGMFTNEKIGSLFGMTYSSITHIVRSIKIRLEKDRRLKENFNQIYSQFKI